VLAVSTPATVRLRGPQQLTTAGQVVLLLVTTIAIQVSMSPTPLRPSHL